MHRTTTVRRAAAVLALAFAATGAAACSDDTDEASTTASTAAASDETTTTAAEASTTTGAAAEAPTFEGEEAVAADVIATVFDSSIPFDDKVGLVEGGEAHRVDHETYLGAADGVAGISLTPTAVAVEGDTATVTYSLSFAGTEVYADLSMPLTRNGDSWIVSTADFCGFLQSARVSCA